jgi:hypothetical protein
MWKLVLQRVLAEVSLAVEISFALSLPSKQCPKACLTYSAPTCRKLKKAPFVCNGCQEKSKCRLQKTYYRAKDAQADNLYSLQQNPAFT